MSRKSSNPASRNSRFSCSSTDADTATTLTVIALEFGYLLGGAVLTETIFSWPGVGRWLFLAVEARDFRAVQGGVLLLATVFILVNLIADVLYAYLDPRIRYD